MSFFNGSKKKLWYTIQPKEGDTTWELLTPTPSMDFLNRSTSTKEGKIRAKDIHDILCKRIAFLSGGKDKRGRPILTIPNVQDPLQHTEYAITTTLKYLSYVAKKTRNLVVILDIRYSTWNAAKPMIGILQYCLRDHIAALYIVKPREFWEKQVANFNFKVNKERLGFKSMLVSPDKLHWYIDQTQLTKEFKGKLYYDHQHWIRNRVHYEKYIGEAEEKLDVFQNFSQKAKQWEEASEGDSSSIKSDSGNVTGPTSPATSSDTLDQHRGFYHVGDTDEAPKRSTAGSREHVYQVSDANRYEQPLRSCDQAGPVPAPRKSLTSVTSPMHRNETRVQSRHRSRSVPPERTEREGKTNNGARSPLYSHVYSLPDYEKVARKRTKSGKLPRSSSEYNVSQESESTTRGHNGPRPLRNRRASRSRNEEIGDERKPKIVSSKSVPNLTKYDDGNYALKRKNSTLVDGEKLLKDLQSLSDENGFNIGRTQPLSDENFSMIQNISNYQEVLSRLEEKNMEKIEKKKERNLSRRKTVTGLPALDGAKGVSQFSHLPSPIEIQEKLKLVYDWFRGPAEAYLNERTSYVESLREVESLTKVHTEILSKCMEKVRSLRDIKSSFENLASSKLSASQKSNSLEPIPQWILSISRSLEIVEKQSQHFQSRLQERSDSLQWSFAFYKSAKKLSASLSSVAQVCKSEATLLDCLDAIQNQMGQLHHHTKTMKELHEVVIKAAGQHVNHIQKLNKENKQTDQRGLFQVSHVHHILSQLQLGVDRCSNLAQGTKVRLDHVYQLKAAQKDVQQAIEWLCDSKTTIQNDNRAFGKSAKEVENLMEQQENIKITGKFYYDNGNKQLSALAVLRRCLELSPHHGAVTPLKRSNSSGQLVSKSGLLLPSLEDAWEEFIESCEERRSKLTVAHLFYKNAEQLLKRGSQLEVDLDNAYVYTTGSQISPLREAHYSFHDNWDKVMKLGDNLLQPSSTSQTQSQDYLHLPIHDHMKQLENLRSSLQAKWAKVKGKNVNSSENLRSPGSSQSWIENVSESTDWVRSKLVQCSPNMFEIGRNLKEATKLQNEHKNLLQDIKEKDSEIFALLEKEQQSEIFTSSSALPSSSSQSTAESQQERKVQKAMSYSLADMWKDLTSLLARRNTVLHATVQFYTATEKFGNHLTCLEQYLHWNELPLDASTARSLLKVLEEMYNQMMDASRTCLTDGGELVNMLKQLKPDNSDRHRASFGSATTSVECNLESLIERQRLLEFDYQSRKKKLEHILKIRQWEEEVDKVATWFELIRLKQLDGNELGFDDSNTHALICHLDQVKEQVQERLEKAKKLINRANAELKAFGNDPVKMQSRDLDRLGESLMEQIQKRKKELAAVQAYYHQVKECEVSLGVLGKKLDSGRFSSDQEEAEEQRKNFLDCINAATLPVLDKADLILKMRENKLEGAEGVVDARDEVIMKQEALFEMIRRLASDASRLHETLVLFKANCDDLKKWLTDMEAEAFSSSTSMPDNMGKSTQFLEWHRLLQHDVERKTSSIRSLIESANLLLETGISNPEIVKEQAEDVKVAWFDLNKKIKQRVSTSEDFVNFLTNLEKLSEDIDKSHALVLHHSKSSTNQLSASYLNELEESVNQIDNECLNIMEDSNRVNTKLRELNTDNFDVSAAVNFVTEKVVRLHKKKSEFKDVWLTWRYKSGINQETSAQIKVVEKNIKTIMDSFEKLEKSVFPNGVISFGKNGESNCILIDELHCRQSTLDDLRSEIEKAVKHAEMLGMRLSSSNELNRDDDVNEDEQLRNIVKEMLISHQNLQLKLKNYKNLLQILQDFYALCSNLQVIMEEFESGFLDPSLSSPQVNDDFYLDVKLGSHDQIKEQVDDKLKDIEVKSDDIEDALQNHYFGLDCPDLVEVKKTIVDMQTMHSDWVTSWTNQRKKLLDQRGLLGFYQDYDKHRNALAVAEERLQSLKKQLPVCRSSLEAEEIEDELSELFSDFEKIEQAWNKFASSRQLEATRSSIEMDAIERTSREVVNKLRGTEKAIRSANTLGKIFKLSNEYDKWNEEIQQIATAIRDKSASIRSLEEAQEIIEMFDDNLLPNIDEQASRSKAVASVIVQADDSAFDSGDEGNDANLSSQTSEREFHELLKSKQFHVKQSLSILRAEADELSTSIDGAREQLKAAPIAHVKPYDMTVLLDENLEKERLYSEMKRKIFDSTSPRTLNEDKPTKYSQISLHVSSSSAFSTSGSSCSNEYTLPEQGPKLGKNTPIKDKFVKNQEMEENNYPKFINNFFQRDSSSASISDNSYSSSTPFGKTVDNNPRSTPPKPPRNKKGRRQFWEQELDDFQPYSRQHRTDLFGSSSNDDPLDDNEKVDLHERLI